MLWVVMVMCPPMVNCQGGPLTNWVSQHSWRVEQCCDDDVLYTVHGWLDTTHSDHSVLVQPRTLRHSLLLSHVSWPLTLNTDSPSVLLPVKVVPDNSLKWNSGATVVRRVTCQQGEHSQCDKRTCQVLISHFLTMLTQLYQQQSDIVESSISGVSGTAWIVYVWEWTRVVFSCTSGEKSCSSPGHCHLT